MKGSFSPRADLAGAMCAAAAGEDAPRCTPPSASSFPREAGFVILASGAASVVASSSKSSRPGLRLVVTLAVAIEFTIAPPSRAAVGPNDIDREVEQLVEQQKFREAALRLGDEVQRLPEKHDTRVRRNELASQALNAYIEAFRAESDDCGLARSGLSLADDYTQGLLSVYGPGAKNSDEYIGMTNLREELDRARNEHGCPGPSATESAEPGSQAPAPAEATEQRGDRGLVVALAVSAGLTGAMLAVSLGTGLSRYKRPFEGAAYKKIYEAAVASHQDTIAGNEVEYGSDDPMCSETNRGINGDVKDACERWENLGKVAAATGVMTGVLGVTTIALAAVLASRRGKSSRAAALLRRHKASVGVAPAGRGGVNVNLGFAF